MPTRGPAFHVWHRDPDSGVRKWCGAHPTGEGALLWKKSQENPENYKVSTIGPTHAYRQERAKILGHSPIPDQPVPTKRAPSQTATEAMAAARLEARRRQSEQIKARDERLAAQAQKRAENDKEVAGMREDAAGLIKQHKQDEADDLSKGVNR